MDLFPDYVAIQWFSFAEQKFYQRIIKVPRAWQDRMLEPALLQTELHGDVMKPRNFIMFGLAPGGEVVVWMMNQIGNEVDWHVSGERAGSGPDIYRVTPKSIWNNMGLPGSTRNPNGRLVVFAFLKYYSASIHRNTDQ